MGRTNLRTSLSLPRDGQTKGHHCRYRFPPKWKPYSGTLLEFTEEEAKTRKSGEATSGEARFQKVAIDFPKDRNPIPCRDK